ncbi:MAG: hypothetical protein LBJ17_02310 [Dysgonamonadaceae bacterium]|jgi:hypothetical protein|nr:hypothetical protein [Dysgonamonadaceae bacterium]
MYKNKGNALTAKILSSLPKNIKPTEYLMDILNISKESAYRRLRNEIPFTFEEITKIVLDLNFSVDEVISLGNHSQASFLVDIGQQEDDYPAFEKTIRDYYHGLMSLSNADNTEVVVAMNSILPFFFTDFDSLFRFAYFKSMQKNSKIPLKNTFADINLPYELKEVQKVINQQLQYCTKGITVIIDSNIVTNLINEILYFYKRKLIMKEELQALKNDMLKMMDIVEEMAQTGYLNNSLEVNIYLSFINIDANSLYMKCDDKEFSSFHLYNMAPLTTNNHSICSLHKKKIESLKKYSRLITQSNEIIQAAFFDKQRENINLIEEKNIDITF